MQKRVNRSPHSRLSFPTQVLTYRFKGLEKILSANGTPSDDI